MKRAILFVLMTALLLCGTAFAEMVRIEPQTTILSSTPQLTVLRIEIPQDQIQRRAQHLFDGEQINDGLGEIIAIAGTGTPVLRITDFTLGQVLSGTLDVAHIAASSSEIATLGEPAVMRDLRVVTVNVNPVVRDERGDVRTVTHVQLVIETSGGGGINTTDEPTSFSYAFYSIYRHMVRNLDDAYPNIPVNGPGRILFLARPNLLGAPGNLQDAPQWQNYLNIKRYKGWTVQVVALTDTTFGSIHAAINSAYYDPSLPGLDYAIIVGDVGGIYGIPTVSHQNPENNDQGYGDNDFYTVEGNDPLPDVIHGRISAQSPTEIVTYISKVNRYETNPDRSNPNWFHSGTFIAGNFSDGSGTYPVTPVWNMEWARQRLVQSGCITNADTCYYHSPLDPPPGSCTQFLVNDINAGVSAVFYRGWGNSECWQYPIFCDDQVDQLSVGQKNPAVFGLVCGTGNFYTQCLGEKWTTGIGSPSNSNGGIAFYGATDLHTNTRHNNALLAGIVQALLVDGMRSMGELTYAGELEAWRQYPREREGGIQAEAYYYIWHVFNILGDPEVPLTICEPRDFNIWTPENVGIGETLLPVSVTSGGQPVEHAVVTIRGAGMNDVVTRVTNEYGVCYLPLNFTQAATANMVIWKGGYFMVQRDLPVIAYAFDPGIAGVVFSDGNDNQLNPGEQVNGTLSIVNRGSAATSYTGSLESLDERLLIPGSGEFTVPMTNPGETQLSTAMPFRCQEYIANGERLMARALISDGTWTAQRDFFVEMYAAEPQVVSILVDDGGNNALDPGESTSLTITFRNAGRLAAGNWGVQMSCFDNSVTILDGDAQLPACGIGEQVNNEDQLRIQAANGVTIGRQVLLRFAFHQNGTYTELKTHFLTVGAVTVNAPTGPDEYGYYAYENIDAGFTKTPTYNWIELVGDGGATQIGMKDDSVNAIDLPAPFMFYGVEHNRMWISSNGWISFGRATIAEFRNWEIPSPIGAPYMICPFYDDLVGDRAYPNDDTLHYVYTRHDAGQSRFIIEWNCFNRRGFVGETPGDPNIAPERFELILEYDNEGDDDILIQYHTINNVDVDNNYATVGIQDSLHLSGLNLTFSNFYPLSVDSLHNGRAIRFTTTPPDNFLGADEPSDGTLPDVFMLHEAYPNPFNPTTELEFDLTERGTVSLTIYDMLGRDVATLIDETREAGRYSITFNGSGLATGLYFARLVQGPNTMVRKLMLVK